MIPRTARDWNRFSKLMMALSAICIIIGFVFAVRTHLFLRRAIPCTGTIVELVEKKNDDGHTLYAPAFTFTDEDGVIHRAFSSTASFPPIGNIGDEIEILYDPDDPKDAEENRFFNLWGIAVIPAGLGGLYFLLFWGVVLFTKRRIESANTMRV